MIQTNIVIDLIKITKIQMYFYTIVTYCSANINIFVQYVFLLITISFDTIFNFSTTFHILQYLNNINQNGINDCYIAQLYNSVIYC